MGEVIEIAPFLRERELNELGTQQPSLLEIDAVFMGIIQRNLELFGLVEEELADDVAAVTRFTPRTVLYYLQGGQECEMDRSLIINRLRVCCMAARRRRAS